MRLNRQLLLICFLFYGSALLAAVDSLQVTAIHLSGNKKTKSQIILRELDFQVGSWLQSESLEARLLQNRNQVFNTHLFNVVEMTYSSDSLAQIEVSIELVEKWYIWPYPVIKFADRNFNIWWETKDIGRLNAGINVNHNNFRGRAEKLMIRGIWGYTRQLEVAYEIPYIDKKKHHGFYTVLAYQSNKEIWHKAENNRLQFLFDPTKRAIKAAYGEMAYIYRPAIFTKHQFGVGVQDLWVSDTVLLASENPNYLAGQLDRQFSLFFHYTFKWDRRDIAYYPLKGHFIEFNFTPRYLTLTKELYASMYLNAEKFFRLNDYFFAGLGFRGKISAPENQPYSLYQSLGYKFFVRGFEPYVVDGQHFGLLKSNIKACLFKGDIRIPRIKMEQFNRAPSALYLTLYADAGYVYSSRFQEPGNTYQNSLLSGFGAGLDIVTFYDRVMRIEYSINGFGRKGLYLHFTAPI